MKKNKGFTLIELLVVIAIIGILSSVVLASLNTARDKGNDAAVKANLANIRAQAEIFYDDATQGNQTYGTESATCSTAGSLFASNPVSDAIASAETASGGSAACTSSDKTTTPALDATSWAIQVPLKSDSTKYWCVDSGGISKEVTTALTIVDTSSSVAAACPTS